MSACTLSHVQLFATLWTVTHHAPLSMGFPRQEYWSGLPFPPSGDLPDWGIEPGLLHILHCRQILYYLSHWGKAHTCVCVCVCVCVWSLKWNLLSRVWLLAIPWTIEYRMFSNVLIDVLIMAACYILLMHLIFYRILCSFEVKWKLLS